MSTMSYTSVQEPISQQPGSTPHTTTVIVNQQIPQARLKRDWRSGLLSCCDDIPICLLVTFFGPCYGCYLVTEADESFCLACCCQGWIVALRSHVRGKLGIEGSIFNDFLASDCCVPCTMCQLGREIKESKASGEWYTV